MAHKAEVGEVVGLHVVQYIVAASIVQPKAQEDGAC
jgi:hypothetical protein